LVFFFDIPDNADGNYHIPADRLWLRSLSS